MCTSSRWSYFVLLGRPWKRERENQNKRVLESVHAWKCLCAGDTSLFRTLIWTPSSGNLTGKVSFKTFYFLSLGKKIFYSSDMCYCSSHHSNVIFCLAIGVVGYTHSRENVSQRASDHWKCVGQSLFEIWFAWQLIIRCESNSRELILSTLCKSSGKTNLMTNMENC